MQYLHSCCFTSAGVRALISVVAKIFLCGLYVILYTQYLQYTTQHASGIFQLNQVADKQLGAEILESVAEQEWDRAIAEIKQLHHRVLSMSDKATITRNDDSATRLKAVARVTPVLEWERAFLAKLAQSADTTAPETYRTQLSHERIVVDFRLIAVLDLHVAQQAWTNNLWWSPNYQANDKIDWFWNGVEAAQDYYGPLKTYDWLSRAGIPHDAAGNPVFLDVPANYSAKLGCGEKILFLASEIEQLDPTPEKHNAGRIMLYRARLAKRLFGPSRDPEWDIFKYDMYHRPAYLPSEVVKGMSPVNKLGDDETRIQVGVNVRQLTLPAQHSPLALYRQLEKRYPDSDSLPRAMYEIGQYYQMRRQFMTAKREYERVMEKFPDHQRSVLARQQLEVMKRPDVLLGRSGVYIHGNQPQIWFTYRNTVTVEFTLRKLHAEQFLADQSDSTGPWRRTPTINAVEPWSHDHDDAINNVGATVKSWTVDLPESSMEAATSSTVVPHDEMGEYLLEARIPGTDEVSRAIILVTSAAIVHEVQPEQSLLTLVDARTGERLPNETLRVIQYDASTKKLRSTAYESNEAGEVIVPSNDEHSALVYARTKSRGKVFLSLFDRGASPWTEPIVASYTATDRPVYRPGEVMHFRSWYRQQREDDPLACPEAGTPLQISIVAPNRSIYKTLDLRCDETGSVDGSIELGKEAALGAYQVFVESMPSTFFRVEEYKRPEYSVSVAPQAMPKLGADVAFDVAANYYFGDPVAAADVDYKWFRQIRRLNFTTPQPFDWLYGPGYGRYGYLYPWLGDEIFKSPSSYKSYGWNSIGWRGVEVASGTAKLDANGRAVVRFDTSKLVSPSNDVVQLTLAVDVRDDSRRSISAEGTTIVAGTPVFTFAELDQGWYQSGDPVKIVITTLDANSQPVQKSGSLKLCMVASDSSQDAAVSLELIDVQPVVTAEDGTVSVTFDDLPAGQYRAIVQADDSLTAQDVADDGASTNAAASDVSMSKFDAAVNFVVYGDELNHQRRRYGALELLPCARTYQPGDTARILVNTNQPPLQLLIEDGLGVRRTFVLAEQSSVIEIPITSQNSPSTLYHASTVRDGKLLRERFELFVPPVDRMLTVAVDAELHEYQPGSEATVRVAVTDSNGAPVSGDVVLAAYDASVLAIQPEVGIGPKQMFLESKPNNWLWNDGDFSSSLGTHQFESSGDFGCPEYSLAEEMFYGPWSVDSQSSKDADPRTVTTRRSLALGGMGGMAPETGDFTSAMESETAATAWGDASWSNDDSNAAHRQYVQPVVREDESATAAWMPHLRLDDRGQALAKFPLPDSLTTWKLRAFSINSKTQLGDGAGVLLTSQPLMVRLQTPRFLVEQDQVVVSAIVHNGMKTEKHVRVELSVPEDLMQPEDTVGAASNDGLVVIVREGRVAAGETQRFDWKLRAIQPGTAQLTVKALSDEASDAMASVLPILPFTMSERQSTSLALKTADAGEFELAFTLPEDLSAGSLSIELTATGSPAKALFEAIPFLIDYPYGCVEQTMSRFYPLAIAADAMRRLDVQAEDFKKPAKSEPRIQLQQNIRRDDLLSSEVIGRIADQGLQRLYRFQHQDGAWGWWEGDSSTPFMTAYVLVGLHTADKAEIDVRADVIERGRRYLASWFRDAGKVASSPLDAQSLAYTVYALSLPWDDVEENIDDDDYDNYDDNDAGDDQFIENDQADTDILENAKSVATDPNAPYARELIAAFRSLLKRRSELNHYGHCLLALSLHNVGKTQAAQQELQNLIRHVQINEDSAALSVEAPERWRWWNSDVETNAWLLRALLAIDPDNPLTEKVVQGLVNNRQNGVYWRSTRDSALAVLALSEYLVAKDIKSEKIEFEYALNDMPPFPVNAPDLPLHPDTHIQLSPVALKSGRHVVTVAKSAGSHLHLNLTTTYERAVDTIPALSDGISIERKYRKLRKDNDALNGKPSGDSQNTFEIGDIIEVELRIRTKQHYEYLAFEDPKLAGCEPLQLQSGSAWDNGLWSNVELRDQTVVFFASSLSPGECVLKYKLRAETPGVFRAMPATGFAMYSPQLRGNTTEQTIVIKDK